MTRSLRFVVLALSIACLASPASAAPGDRPFKGNASGTILAFPILTRAPAGVRAALEIVIGEEATAYAARALASARSPPAASVIGAVVAAACSGDPTDAPATEEAMSVAPVPC